MPLNHILHHFQIQFYFFVFILFFRTCCTDACCIPIKVLIQTMEYANEITWETDPPSDAFFYGEYKERTRYEHDFCLSPNTTFTFVAMDSYGDGWNGGTYTVFVDGFQVLGPSTFTEGYIFAEESFTTCACACNLDCQSAHRYCCINENQCGECMKEFFLNETTSTCEKAELSRSEIEAWEILFNNTKGWNWKECNSLIEYDDPCKCESVSCEIAGSQKTVTKISLNENGMSGTLPREIGNFLNLKELQLVHNDLSGVIPPEIEKLTNLKVLQLNYNRFTKIPPEIGNMHALEHFSVILNNLNCTIPAEIGNLTNLRMLLLSVNQLSGSIPREIGHLTNLTHLSFYSNRLTGSIPPEIENLKSIRWIYFYLNQLTGTIPTQLFKLQTLIDLDIGLNQLTGIIPEEVGNLGDINRLYFDSNQLTGTIPRQISQLKHVYRLYLDSNHLTGSIPIELFNMTSLKQLHLSSNRLTGIIPYEVGNLIRLSRLFLQENMLNGTIPHEIGNLVNLETLLLDSNQLTGTIPLDLSRMISLKTLSLHSNQLTGSLPFSLGQLNNLTFVDISHNKLVGTFPEQWRDNLGVLQNGKNNLRSPFFKELRQFRVCCNQLTGHLRDFINPFLTVTSLAQLDISNNQISGSFEFWSSKWFEFSLISGLQSGLVSLIYLDVSFNEIEYDLPQELPTALSLFFVSNNQLKGSIPEAYSHIFIFWSKNNKLRHDKLPLFLKTIDDWIDVTVNGVECQHFDTIDGSAKTFDIQPVYDHFSRCRCKPGYFNLQSDSSTTNPFVMCDPAPPGFYTSLSNRLNQPIPCPLGHFSTRYASTQCDVCTSNTFSLGGKSECKVCLSSTNCENGIISLKENKWMNEGKLLNEDSKDEHIYDCLNNEACVVKGLNVTCAWEKGYDNSSVLCSECLEGYYSSDRLKKTCRKCTQAHVILSYVLVVLLLMVGSFLVYKTLMRAQKRGLFKMSYQRAKNENSLCNCIGALLWRILCLNKCSNMISGWKIHRDWKGIVRVFVGHVQVLIILSDLQLSGPEVFHNAIGSSIGVFMPTLSLSSFKCALEMGFDITVLVAAFTPLLLLVMLIFMAFMISAKINSNRTITFRSIITVFVFFFYLVHPAVMRQLLQAFHFHQQVIEGSRHLQSDMFLKMSSSKYSIIFAVAAIGVVVYGLLFPLLVVLSLIKNSKKDSNGDCGLDKSIFQREFGFLYQGYHLNGHLYLWEAVIYLRKSLLLLLGVFFGRDAFLQSYLASMVLIIALTLHTEFHPYRSDRLNRVEALSLTVLAVTQVCLLLSSHYNFGGDWKIEVFVSVVLIILNSTFFVAGFRGLVIGSKLSVDRFASIDMNQVMPTDGVDRNESESRNKKLSIHANTKNSFVTNSRRDNFDSVGVYKSRITPANEEESAKAISVEGIGDAGPKNVTANITIDIARKLVCSLEKLEISEGNQKLDRLHELMCVYGEFVVQFHNVCKTEYEKNTRKKFRECQISGDYGNCSTLDNDHKELKPEEHSSKHSNTALNAKAEDESVIEQRFDVDNIYANAEYVGAFLAKLWKNLLMAKSPQDYIDKPSTKITTAKAEGISRIGEHITEDNTNTSYQ